MLINYIGAPAAHNAWILFRNLRQLRKRLPLFCANFSPNKFFLNRSNTLQQSFWGYSNGSKHIQTPWFSHQNNVDLYSPSKCALGSSTELRVIPKKGMRGCFTCIIYI